MPNDPTPKISPEAVEAAAEVLQQKGAKAAPMYGVKESRMVTAEHVLEAAYPAIRSSVLEEALRPEIERLREEAAEARDKAIRHKGVQGGNQLIGRGRAIDDVADRLEAILDSLASEGGERT